jgi:hypothetical protein
VQSSTFQFYPSPIQPKRKEKSIPLSSYTCQEKKNPSTSILHVSSSSSHVSNQFTRNMGGHDSLQPVEQLVVDARNCTRPSWRCPSSRPFILDNYLVTAASSSSTLETVGFTPRPCSNRRTTWHMQHPRLPSLPHIHSTVLIHFQFQPPQSACKPWNLYITIGAPFHLGSRRGSPDFQWCFSKSQACELGLVPACSQLMLQSCKGNEKL